MPALKYRTKQPYPDDPEILASITESQLRSLSVRATAARAQIAKETLVKWLNLGRAELVAYDAGEIAELGSLGLFVTQYEKAATDQEAVNTSAIVASIHDKTVNFVPALILNKARNPADWIEARNVTVESRSFSVSVSVALPSLPEQQLLALLKDKLDQGVKLLPPPPPQ